MNYFTRKTEESIRYCAACDMRTRHERPQNMRALWTCRDSGHRHPTKEDQEKGLLTMDDFETDIRKAVELCIFTADEGCECIDTCTCYVLPLDSLISRVKDKWQDFASYPSNRRIAEVVFAMESEGLLTKVLECSIDCERPDETGDEEIRCVTPCQAMMWTKAVARYITLPEPGEDGDDTGDNPAWEPFMAQYRTEGLFADKRNEWAPEGERLRLDIRRFTPRQTSAEYRLFYMDAERPLTYDRESRTYVRDDLPKVFNCGCSRDKVLAGNCERWGRDGRSRGWQSGTSYLERDIERAAQALAESEPDADPELTEP